LPDKSHLEPELSQTVPALLLKAAAPDAGAQSAVYLHRREHQNPYDMNSGWSLGCNSF